MIKDIDLHLSCHRTLVNNFGSQIVKFCVCARKGKVDISFICHFAIILRKRKQSQFLVMAAATVLNATHRNGSCLSFSCTVFEGIKPTI